jgi:hypothetical protein
MLMLVLLLVLLLVLVLVLDRCRYRQLATVNFLPDSIHGLRLSGVRVVRHCPGIQNETQPAGLEGLALSM